MKTKLLDMLWSVPSVSGEEHLFSTMLDKYLQIPGTWKHTDEYGNLYYGIGKHLNPDIVLIAHMDEIGLIISSITDRGMIICCSRGLIYPKQYYGQQVKIYSHQGAVFGTIISNRSIQKCSDSPLVIDIGCSDYCSAIAKVSVGDSVLIDSSYHICYPNHIIGRALDNKIGIYIILNYVEELFQVNRTTDDLNLCVVFTTGEEISSDSAAKAINVLNPEVCIVIDGVNETEYSEMSNVKYGDVRVGSGALLYGINYPELAGLSFQKYGNSKYTNTEYDEIRSLVNHGYLLGYPIRYMHSNGELVSIHDINNCESILHSIVNYYIQRRG